MSATSIHRVLHSNLSDVLVIGGGAAGLYAAAFAASLGRSVSLLSAVTGPEDPRRSYVEGAAEHRGLQEAWLPGLGGTTQSWGGQLWPWAIHDIRVSPGSPAWPTDVTAAMQEGVPRVLRRLGLSKAHDAILSGLLVESARARRLSDAHGGAPLSFSSWMPQSQRNFAKNRALGKYLRSVTYRQGTACSVAKARSGLVEVEYVDAGERKAIVAGRVVLAAGVPGNSLVLAQSELGGTHVGTGFMDHVGSAVAEFDVVKPQKTQLLIGPYYHRGVAASPKVLSDASLQCSQRGYAHWQVKYPSWLDVNAVKRRDWKSVMSGDRQQMARNLPALAAAAGRSVVRPARPVISGSRAVLRVDLEQTTSERNFLSLDRASNKGSLHWSAYDGLAQDCRSFAGQYVARLDETALGLKFRRLAQEEPIDIFHMMGGTAVGSVVDSDLRLLENGQVLVGGASVFPSGGVANPTLMALALLDSRLERFLGGRTNGL